MTVVPLPAKESNTISARRVTSRMASAIIRRSSLPFAERIDPGIFPNICPVAAVLAKLKRVGMNGTAALEYEAKLVLGAIEAAHAGVVLRPDHEVLEK